MRILKSLIVLISLSFVFACSSAKTGNTQNNNNPEGRKQYAKSLFSKAKVGSGAAIIDVADTDNKTLFVHSVDVSEKDCSDFAKSEFVEDAVKIGFDKLTCRNEIDIKEWSFSLK